MFASLFRELVSRATDPIPAVWLLLKPSGPCLRVPRALQWQPGWVQRSGTVLFNTDREMQLLQGRASSAQLLYALPEVWELPVSTAPIASPPRSGLLFADAAPGCHLVWLVVHHRSARKP